MNKYIRQISNGLKVCPYLGPYPALLKGGRAFAEESRPLRPCALPEEQPQPLRIQVRRCREMDSSGQRNQAVYLTQGDWWVRAGWLATGRHPKLWRARSLAVWTATIASQAHFAAFFKLYKITRLLHRLHFKISRFSQISVIFADFHNLLEIH